MGQIFIDIGFASSLIATLIFISGIASKKVNLKFARIFFHGAVIFTIASAAYLMHLIITHQFQYTYVWEYSSKDLPFNLLISTFYAGQEGSFHLWAFFMAVLGVFLLAFITKRDKAENIYYEPHIMGVYSLLLTFLLFILIIKSPYNLVWESFPTDVKAGFVPPDGRGLNPLLQNFWMTIHPPILFAGFTALAIPFCFAIAALIKNQYDKWLKLALPWTIFGAMVLGLGIMLGGYWAYGVLGWGGYWGWDPVENASFVPWIFIVAAIHSMITEHKTGKFKKTSLLLCIVAYVMVLYSTFLTRSGILGDASVHSFVDPGQQVYLFLIVFLSLFGLGGFGLILFRLKDLKTEKTDTSELLSRESALFIGTLTLCAAAIVIAVGTSWPIFSKSTVEPDFYNKMNLPLAILIAVINGFSILLRWKHSEEKAFFKSMYIPLGLTGAVMIALVIIGLQNVLMAVFAAGSLFAFFINAELAYRIISKSSYKAGPYVAHIGIMLLFLGIIGSSKYSEEVNLSLPINETKEALGYKMTYKGATQIPGETMEKYHFNVVCEKEGKTFLLQPVMFYSEYSQGVMKNPDIANLVTKDLYLSPMSLEVPKDFAEEDIIKINKNEEKEAKGLKIKFIDFDRSKFNKDAMQEGKENIMGAEIEVTVNGKTEKITAQQQIASDHSDPIPIQLASTDRFSFYLTDINVQKETSIGIAVVDNMNKKSDQPAEMLVLTASIKPFINLVWIGTAVMVLGFFFSMVNRYRRVTREGQVIEQKDSGNVITNGISKNGNGKKKQLPKKEKV